MLLGCKTPELDEQTMHLFLTHVEHTGWPKEQSVRLPFWEINESEPRGSEPWWSQTNDFKIDTGRILVMLATSKIQTG